MSAKLEGRRALVTGAGRRIGRCIALALAHAGADVALHYRESRDEAEAAAEEIRGLGRQAWVSAHDLSRADITGEWFASLSEWIGGVDILVNSASVFPEDRYETITPESLGLSMAVHLLSPLAMIRTMAASGTGASVVNILDARAMDRDPAHASYHLGKAALLTATRELAVEMAPALRVNAVAPGIILAPEGHGEEWYDRLKKSNPLNNRGTPRDVADAVLFLCQADFVTGQVIFVDGGRHLMGRYDGI